MIGLNLCVKLNACRLIFLPPTQVALVVWVLVRRILYYYEYLRTYYDIWLLFPAAQLFTELCCWDLDQTNKRNDQDRQFIEQLLRAIVNIYNIMMMMRKICGRTFSHFFITTIIHRLLNILYTWIHAPQIHKGFGSHIYITSQYGTSVQ